jgi:hypothetical protein
MEEIRKNRKNEIFELIAKLKLTEEQKVYFNLLMKKIYKV